MFEPVWEDGKCALLGANGKFLSVDDDDLVLCSQNSVGPMEVIRIRSNKEREDVNKKKEDQDAYFNRALKTPTDMVSATGQAM